MILSALFFLFLLLENLLLPALFGPGSFLIIPTFTFAVVVYGNNLKLRFFQIFIFLVFTEFFTASEFGSIVFPFICVAILHLWLNRFLNIKSGLTEGGIIFRFFGGTLYLTFLVFSFAFVSLLFQFHNLSASWESLIIFIRTSGYQTIGWSLAFIILFKYLFNKTI